MKLSSRRRRGQTVGLLLFFNKYVDDDDDHRIPKRPQRSMLIASKAYAEDSDRPVGICGPVTRDLNVKFIRGNRRKVS